MIVIEWDKKYEVGHDRIDFEHRIFLDLIRALAAESNGGMPSARFYRLLHETVKYGEFHFVSEENIMEDADYPGLEAHRALHRMLLSQLRDQVHDVSLGRLSGEDLVRFLLDWFALHTTSEDKKLRDYLVGAEGARL